MLARKIFHMLCYKYIKFIGAPTAETSFKEWIGCPIEIAKVK